MNKLDGANPKTATPINFVHTIPTKTDVPIVVIDYNTLSHLLPSAVLNLITICATNSTAKPMHVTKLTTLIALISIYFRI